MSVCIVAGRIVLNIFREQASGIQWLQRGLLQVFARGLEATIGRAFLVNAVIFSIYEVVSGKL